METNYSLSMGSSSALQSNAKNILRKSKNVLLVRGDVGHAKPFTMNLPPKGTAFGKPSRFEESAASGKLHCSIVFDFLLQLQQLPYLKLVRICLTRKMIESAQQLIYALTIQFLGKSWILSGYFVELML